MVLDGGLATELEGRGADLRDPLWSARLLLENPGLIREVHADYYRAGADLATAASYQTSVAGFVRRGVDRREALSLIRTSVTLAREARDIFWTLPERPADRLWPLVAGTAGPYGAALADGSEYRGRYGVGRRTLQDFHLPRLEALLEAGADLLAVETIPSPREAEAVLQLLPRWPDARVWVSFTCRDDAHLSEGQPVEDAARVVRGHPQVVAVGVNCVSPAQVDGLLERLGPVTDLPLVVYPNSGEVWDAERRTWIGSPARFDPIRDPVRWQRLGARLIGGCCRTTPTTIRDIRRGLRTN